MTTTYVDNVMGGSSAPCGYSAPMDRRQLHCGRHTNPVYLWAYEWWQEDGWDSDFTYDGIAVRRKEGDGQIPLLHTLSGSKGGNAVAYMRW